MPRRHGGGEAGWIGGGRSRDRWRDVRAARDGDGLAARPCLMKGTLPTPSLCLSSMLLLSAAAGGAENIFALAPPPGSDWVFGRDRFVSDPTL